jgi:hypothetical protein
MAAGAFHLGEQGALDAAAIERSAHEVARSLFFETLDQFVIQHQKEQQAGGDDEDEIQKQHARLDNVRTHVVGRRSAQGSSQGLPQAHCGVEDHHSRKKTQRGAAGVAQQNDGDEQPHDAANQAENHDAGDHRVAEVGEEEDQQGSPGREDPGDAGELLHHEEAFNSGDQEGEDTADQAVADHRVQEAKERSRGGYGGEEQAAQRSRTEGEGEGSGAAQTGMGLPGSCKRERKQGRSQPEADEQGPVIDQRYERHDSSLSAGWLKVRTTFVRFLQVDEV